MKNFEWYTTTAFLSVLPNSHFECRKIAIPSTRYHINIFVKLFVNFVGLSNIFAVRSCSSQHNYSFPKSRHKINHRGSLFCKFLMYVGAISLRFSYDKIVSTFRISPTLTARMHERGTIFFIGTRQAPPFPFLSLPLCIPLSHFPFPPPSHPVP